MRTTPDADQSKQFFKITHPFHPQRGRRLELVSCRRRWGQWRVCYYTDDQQIAYLPASWTDAGPPDCFGEQSQGRAIAPPEDLLALAELIGKREHALVKEKMPQTSG